MVIEIRIVATCVGRTDGKGHEGTLWGYGSVVIVTSLIWVVVAWLRSCVHSLSFTRHICDLSV